MFGQVEFVRSCTRAALMSGAFLAASVAWGDWSPAVALPGYTSASTVDMPSPAVADDGSAAIVWRGLPYDIWVATRSGPSGSWAVQRISQNVSTSNPTIAMNGAGDTVIAWSGFGFAMASYRPAGGSWEPYANLQTSNVQGRAWAAINSAGEAIVGWVAFNSGESRYEARVTRRTKTGPWPPSDNFELAAQPAGIFGMDVAIDDAGNSAVAWTLVYANLINDNAHRGTVVRVASRPPGGSWGGHVDASERGKESGAIPCEPGHGPFPEATQPRLAADPKTGDLALSYFFDPTSWEYFDHPDHGVGCYSTYDDSMARLATGSVVQPPTGGHEYGTNVHSTNFVGVGSGPPAIALRGGKVVLGWREGAESSTLADDRVLFGIALFGAPAGLALQVSPADTFAVAMGGDGRGHLVSGYFDPDPHPTRAWSATVGSTAGAAVELTADGTLDVGAAAGCDGTAIAALAGADGKIYLSVNPGPGTPCGYIFGHGFEDGPPP